MCEHGDTVDVLVTIPEQLSYTGKRRLALKQIDRCIAPMVQELNRRGIPTVGCCCGHGKASGTIILEGRITILLPMED